ncbi:hypothetical protein DSECCO2_485990 [anaerobic digester metagenome]
MVSTTSPLSPCPGSGIPATPLSTRAAPNSFPCCTRVARAYSTETFTSKIRSSAPIIAGWLVSIFRAVAVRIIREGSPNKFHVSVTLNPPSPYLSFMRIQAAMEMPPKVRVVTPGFFPPRIAATSSWADIGGNQL